MTNHIDAERPPKHCNQPPNCFMGAEGICNCQCSTCRPKDFVAQATAESLGVKLKDEVRAAHVSRSNHQPCVHGNGFIQLDLTPRRRLHVWGDPRVPRQSVPSTIHDHTFSFSSRVYAGQLVHRCIDIEHNNDGAYQLYRAVTNRGEDTRLVNSESRYDALIIREHLLKAGDTYRFQAREFHETVAPWLCVTVIDKDGPTLSQGGANPNVLVPFGLEPDNTFNRYQTQPDFLWRIIFEAIEGL